VEPYVSRFLRASLAWLALGTGLGVAMAIQPRWVVYRLAHLHALLLGFVMMMIAGVAYHVIPRITMAALHAPRVARAHVWIANAGLLLLLCGFMTRPHGVRWAPVVLALGGVLSASGAWLFAWNLWRTLDRAMPLPQPRPRQLPQV
jgi:cbb3-type cytochrome oxidase subunit 1